MANTTAVYARVDTTLKEDAEAVLHRLGITPTSAIQMLYSQIVLQNGLPFTPRIPLAQPTAIGGMTQAQLDSELRRGFDSLTAGRTFTADEIDAEFAGRPDV